MLAMDDKQPSSKLAAPLTLFARRPRRDGRQARTADNQRQCPPRTERYSCRSIQARHSTTVLTRAERRHHATLAWCVANPRFRRQWSKPRPDRLASWLWINASDATRLAAPKND